MPQPGVAVPAAHLRNIEARVQEVADLVRGVEARVRAELSEDLGARVDLLARRVEALEGELGRPGPATCAEALGTEARRAEKLRECSASAAPCGSHPDPTSSTPTCYNVAPAPVNSNGQVPGESQMLFAVSPEYVLAESIWDASIFIGLDGFHHLSDTFTLVCLLMKNMILQLVLTSVVWEFMCKDPAAPERLQDLLQFRLTSGHHVSSSVGDSRTSMIAEVCREAKNDALHIATHQIDFWSNFSSYLRVWDPFGLKGGQLLCSIVIFLWVCLILTEVDCTCRFVHALRSLPRGDSTQLVAENDQSFTFRSISSARLYSLYIFVILPRAGITVFLLLTGMSFLTSTVSLEQILIDSLALGFILNIDEMIYPIFVPGRVQQVQSKLTSFELKAYTGNDLNSVVLTRALDVMHRLPLRLLWVAIAFLCTGLTIVNVLHPRVQRMEVAVQILCEGNTDFVYAVAPDTGTVHATKTYSVSEDREGELIVQNTILQFTGLHDVLQDSDVGNDLLADFWPQNTPAGIIYNSDRTAQTMGEAETSSTGFEFIKTVSTSNIQDLSFLGRCEDFSPEESHQAPFVIQALLRYATDGVVDSCAGGEFVGISQWYNMSHYRALCPVTSGCSKTWLFFSHPHWGCPEECKSDNRVDRAFRDVLSDASCTDDGNEPWRTQAMVEYVSGLSDYVTQRTGFYERLTSASTSNMISAVISAYENATDRTYPQTVAYVQHSVSSGLTFQRMSRGIYELAPGLPMYTSDGVELVGCALWTDAVFQDILSLNLCSTLYHQSIAFMCPERCRCQSSWQQSCPSRCSTSTFG